MFGKLGWFFLKIGTDALLIEVISLAMKRLFQYIRAFLKDDEDTRWTTVVEVGNKHLTYEGQWEFPEEMPADFRAYPEVSSEFVNVKFPKLNPYHDSKLSPSEFLLKYGNESPEYLHPAVAKYLYSYEVKLPKIISLPISMLPRFITLPFERLGKFVVYPVLLWIYNHVTIPFPVMLTLRYSAWILGQLVCVLNLANEFGHSFSIFVAPLLSFGLKNVTTPEDVEGLKESKSLIFKDSPSDMPEGKEYLWFLFRPICWCVAFNDRYKTHPFFRRFSRVGNYEIKTLKRSPYHLGQRVMVGGTRIRFPGMLGAKTNRRFDRLCVS